MTETEKWQDKVKKLLKRAQDPTVSEGERENLIEKATYLAAKFGFEAIQAEEAGDKVTSITLNIVGSYALKQKLLVHGVFSAFGCRPINLGAKMEVFGFPGDLDRAKTLYTSLFIQMLVGLASADKDKPDYVHGKAWNSSWLNGFINRVVKRVEIAYQQAKREASTGGNGMALVLVRRDELVKNAFNQAYPNTRKSHGSRSTQSRAYGLGEQAGSRADIGQSRVGGNRAALGR